MNKAADDFVIEFCKNPNIDFIANLCRTIEHKIHHHIWRGIIFPFVKQELDNNPIAIKCLIQAIQNLYSDRTAHAELGWLTESQLIDKYLVFYPNDEWANTRKRDDLSRWLNYTIHEWPSGVLYGNNGATLEQCMDILDAVAELRAIDREKIYEELCSDVEKKTTLYRARLANAHCTGARDT